MKYIYGYQVESECFKTTQPMCKGCAEYIKEHFVFARVNKPEQTPSAIVYRPLELSIKQTHFIMQDYDPNSCWECGRKII